MQINIFCINYFNRDQEKITYLVFCLVYFVFCLAYLVFGVCGVLFGVHYIFWRTLCILRRNWCLWHWDVVFLTFRIREGLSNSSITKNVQIWVFNLWINFPKSSPFCFLCRKRYADLKKVHHPRLWGLWQLWGMAFKCRWCLFFFYLFHFWLSLI